MRKHREKEKRGRKQARSRLLFGLLLTNYLPRWLLTGTAAEDLPAVTDISWRPNLGKRALTADRRLLHRVCTLPVAAVAADFHSRRQRRGFVDRRCPPPTNGRRRGLAVADCDCRTSTTHGERDVTIDRSAAQHHGVQLTCINNDNK